MTTSTEFLNAVSRRATVQRHEAAHFLPTILMMACTDVLQVAGAGLSIISDIRLPLGSSDRHAAFIERLQFTTGAGPCLQAANTGEPTVVSEDRIAEAWPAFHTEMVDNTVYRSTMSVPLSAAGFTAALDLYGREPSGSGFPPVHEVMTAVVAPMTVLLGNSPKEIDQLGVELPVWMKDGAVDTRLDAWRAVGMIMQETNFSSLDALATLRAHAYARSTSVDQISHELVTRTIRPRDVL